MAMMPCRPCCSPPFSWGVKGSSSALSGIDDVHRPARTTLVPAEASVPLFRLSHGSSRRHGHRHGDGAAHFPASFSRPDEATPSGGRPCWSAPHQVSSWPASSAKKAAAGDPIRSSCPRGRAAKISGFHCCYPSHVSVYGAVSTHERESSCRQNRCRRSTSGR